MWNFKLEVTRTDHFLEEAKRVCEGEAVCEHEAASEPGHMLACLVGKRHEAKSIQCSQFLFQVCCLSVTLSCMHVTIVTTLLYRYKLCRLET